MSIPDGVYMGQMAIRIWRKWKLYGSLRRRSMTTGCEPLIEKCAIRKGSAQQQGLLMMLIGGSIHKHNTSPPTPDVNCHDLCCFVLTSLVPQTQYTGWLKMTELVPWRNKIHDKKKDLQYRCDLLLRIYKLIWHAQIHIVLRIPHAHQQYANLCKAAAAYKVPPILSGGQ
jgi:hypothetical protein